TDRCNPFKNVELQSALVMGAKTDLLFPTHQQKEIAELLSKTGCNSTLKITDSIQGHDAFLVDEENYSAEIAEYLNQLEI
ncbi:MAG: hypothetical protein KDI59_08710, partial [Xanthomonadales bacterium]|nr:hypothetical protein [Xanthomonadales bacterium]